MGDHPEWSPPYRPRSPKPPSAVVPFPGVAIDQERPVAAALGIQQGGEADQNVGSGQCVAGVEKQQIVAARPCHRPVHGVIRAVVGRAFSDRRRIGQVGEQRRGAVARAAVLHQPFESAMALGGEACMGSPQAIRVVARYRYDGDHGRHALTSSLGPATSRPVGIGPWGRHIDWVGRTSRATGSTGLHRSRDSREAVMTAIKAGDWVKLVADRSASGLFEVVQIDGDHLALKRDHIVILNVHLDDITAVGAKRQALSA